MNWPLGSQGTHPIAAIFDGEAPIELFEEAGVPPWTASKQPGLSCNASPGVGRSPNLSTRPPIASTGPGGPPGNYWIPTGLAVDTTAFLRVFSQSSERLCKAGSGDTIRFGYRVYTAF